LTEVGPPAQPRTLAAARDASHILTSTERGLLACTDDGRTWPAGRRFLLAGWADKATAMGVTPTRALAVTTDAGATWTTAKARADSAQAISASRTSGGTLEVIAVTDSGNTAEAQTSASRDEFSVEVYASAIW